MSILSELSAVSADGNTTTTIRFSGRDQYVEIVQSKIRSGSKKCVNKIQLTPGVMSSEDAFLFCNAVEQAFEVVFAAEVPDDSFIE